MEPKLLLVKCLTLIYRERQLKDLADSSADLVKTALETVSLPEPTVGLHSDADILRSLKETILELCQSGDEIDLVTLLQRVKLNCSYDDNLYETIEQGLTAELTPEAIKRTITNLRKSLNNYFRLRQIDEVLSRAAYKFRYHRDDIKDVNEFIASLVGQLEPLTINTTYKDPAVVTDVDLSDDSAMLQLFTEVKTRNTSDGIMRLGWEKINRMLQGGLRRGETIMSLALPHKYKTGFSLSIFAQVALFNKPYMLDPNKKPLLLRISFEDPSVSDVQFIYQYLHFNETGEKADVQGVSVEEMTRYVKSRLSVNGYHIKLMHVDPSQWTYKNICNKILELEAKGYEIHLLVVDYLSKMPTTGCVTGPSGIDLRDMVRRIRNFCAPRKITFYTPHQLSTEAKQLIRNGVAEDRFVKELIGKGYSEGSKQLDQEVDCELYFHLFSVKRKTYLSVQRGKHRIPTILDERYKYVIFEFPPNGMPIPHDSDGVERGFYSFKEALAGIGESSSSRNEDLVF